MPVADPSSSSPPDARLTPAERRYMRRIGVSPVAGAPMLRLSCDACARTWVPEIGPGDRIKRGHWRCSKGCSGPAQVAA